MPVSAIAEIGISNFEWRRAFSASLTLKFRCAQVGRMRSIFGCVAPLLTREMRECDRASGIQQ